MPKPPGGAPKSVHETIRFANELGTLVTRIEFFKSYIVERNLDLKGSGALGISFVVDELVPLIDSLPDKLQALSTKTLAFAVIAKKLPELKENLIELDKKLASAFDGNGSYLIEESPDDEDEKALTDFLIDIASYGLEIKESLEEIDNAYQAITTPKAGTAPDGDKKAAPVPAMSSPSVTITPAPTHTATPLPKEDDQVLNAALSLGLSQDEQRGLLELSDAVQRKGERSQRQKLLDVLHYYKHVTTLLEKLSDEERKGLDDKRLTITKARESLLHALSQLRPYDEYQTRELFEESGLSYGEARRTLERSLNEIQKNIALIEREHARLRAPTEAELKKFEERAVAIFGEAIANRFSQKMLAHYFEIRPKWSKKLRLGLIGYDNETARYEKLPRNIKEQGKAVKEEADRAFSATLAALEAGDHAQLKECEVALLQALHTLYTLNGNVAAGEKGKTKEDNLTQATDVKALIGEEAYKHLTAAETKAKKVIFASLYKQADLRKAIKLVYGNDTHEIKHELENIEAVFSQLVTSLEKSDIETSLQHAATQLTLFTHLYRQLEEHSKRVGVTIPSFTKTQKVPDTLVNKLQEEHHKAPRTPGSYLITSAISQHAWDELSKIGIEVAGAQSSLDKGVTHLVASAHDFAGYASVRPPNVDDDYIEECRELKTVRDTTLEVLRAFDVSFNRVAHDGVSRPKTPHHKKQELQDAVAQLKTLLSRGVELVEKLEYRTLQMKCATSIGESEYTLERGVDGIQLVKYTVTNDSHYRVRAPGGRVVIASSLPESDPGKTFLINRTQHIGEDSRKAREINKSDNELVKKAVFLALLPGAGDEERRQALRARFESLIGRFTSQRIIETAHETRVREGLPDTAGGEDKKRQLSPEVLMLKDCILNFMRTVALQQSTKGKLSPDHNASTLELYFDSFEEALQNEEERHISTWFDDRESVVGDPKSDESRQTALLFADKVIDHIERRLTTPQTGDAEQARLAYQAYFQEQGFLKAIREEKERYEACVHEGYLANTARLRVLCIKALEATQLENEAGTAINERHAGIRQSTSSYEAYAHLYGLTSENVAWVTRMSKESREEAKALLAEAHNVDIERERVRESELHMLMQLASRHLQGAHAELLSGNNEIESSFLALRNAYEALEDKRRLSQHIDDDEIATLNELVRDLAVKRTHTTPESVSHVEASVDEALESARRGLLRRGLTSIHDTLDALPRFLAPATAVFFLGSAAALRYANQENAPIFEAVEGLARGVGAVALYESFRSKFGLGQGKIPIIGVFAAICVSIAASSIGERGDTSVTKVVNTPSGVNTPTKEVRPLESSLTKPGPSFTSGQGSMFEKQGITSSVGAQHSFINLDGNK